MTTKTTAERLRELKATRKSLSDHLDRGLRCAGQSIKYLDIAVAALTRLQEAETTIESFREGSEKMVLKGIEMRGEIDRLQSVEAENERLKKGIIAVEDLIEQSYGVAGLHYNDDDAPWSDLLAGGRYEEWLLDYSAALASTKSKQEGGV